MTAIAPAVAASAPVTPLRATPGIAFHEPVSDCVSAILVARGVATTNLRLDDPLELEVEITAEDPHDPELQVLITARSLFTDSDPDIQGLSRPSDQNAAMLSLASEALLLLYRALARPSAWGRGAAWCGFRRMTAGSPASCPIPGASCGPCRLPRRRHAKTSTHTR